MAVDPLTLNVTLQTMPLVLTRPMWVPSFRVRTVLRPVKSTGAMVAPVHPGVIDPESNVQVPAKPRRIRTARRCCRNPGRTDGQDPSSFAMAGWYSDRFVGRT